MKISVVIPCYNAQQWITQTLESVLAQTFPAYEIFVIDDGSSDRSVELVQTIAKTSPVPITLIYSDRLGPAGARNQGIEASTGDWIAFLDADDWWKPNHLERIQAAVANSKDVVYLASAEHFSINVNRVVSRSDAPFATLQQNIDHNTYFSLYQKHGLLELSASAISRQHLEEVGGFNPDFQGAEDFEMIMRAVCGRTLTYDPIPSSYYRCNNPQSYSRKLAQDAGRLTAYFRVLQSLQDRYAIPPSLLSGRAKTLASKSMNIANATRRQEVLQLVWSYLSQSQKVIFTAASYFPSIYVWLNEQRSKLRGPQYSPRQVID